MTGESLYDFFSKHKMPNFEIDFSKHVTWEEKKAEHKITKGYGEKIIICWWAGFQAWDISMCIPLKIIDCSLPALFLFEQVRAKSSIIFDFFDRCYLPRFWKKVSQPQSIVRGVNRYPKIPSMWFSHISKVTSGQNEKRPSAEQSSPRYFFGQKRTRDSKPLNLVPKIYQHNFVAELT